jgi:hypothetical protein
MRNEIVVMQVLRVPPLGKLVIEVNKQRYESLAEVTDENIRRLILAAAGELINFAGGYEALVETGVAAPVTPARPTETPAAPPSIEPTREQQQAEFLASLEAQRDELKTAPPPPEPSLANVVRPRPKKARPPVASQDMNIIAQIDALLQKQITDDPSLAERSIHLEQDPTGGLRIEVDGTYYQRPADIKEPKIQVCIKRALKEWESS